MKLKEEQAFKVTNIILSWIDLSNPIPPEDIADFVMNELINFELGEK